MSIKRTEIPIKAEPETSRYMSDGEIDKIFDYKSVLEKIDFIFEKIGIEK